MPRMQKHNLYNIKRTFEQKTDIKLFTRPVTTYRKSIRLAALVALLSVLCLLLVAFTWPLFSPLDGDALTLCATYKGDGIVTIQVENRSHKKLEFQPQTKLVKWITGEEIEPLSDSVVFDGTSIAPNSTGTLIIDLSDAYDIAFLEQSLATEWYYLVLTNYNFVFGQEWKCSVYFGTQQLEDQPAADDLYSLDTEIVTQIEEELRFYFEDDFTGVFAANSLHYQYLQKVGELLLRSGKNIVPSTSGSLMAAPVPDDIMFNEKLHSYNTLGQQSTVQDAFGKLVGATEYEHIKYLCYHMPYSSDPEDTGWCLPLLYYMTYEVSAIKNKDDCTFIHGQIVSFEELEPYKLYEDSKYVCYDATHLFYTDLRGYIEAVLDYRSATDQNFYFDENIFAEISFAYNYYKENLTIVTWDEFLELRGHCAIREEPSADELVKNGLRGEIVSDIDIESVEITITAEADNVIYAGIFNPESTRSQWSAYGYDLSDASEVNEIISGLREGVYTIEVAVWLDTEIRSYRSLWEMVFVTGNASWPGLQ